MISVEYRTSQKGVESGNIKEALIKAYAGFVRGSLKKVNDRKE